MSNTMDMTSILAAISSMESQLNALKSALAVPSGKPHTEAAPKKARKPRDPTLPPTEWIVFTGRVRALLKSNGFSTGKENQMFCSFLKEQRPMADWTDADILSARSSWNKPEHSKQELAGKNKRKSSDASGTASDASAAVADAETKPKRKGKPLSDEQKAKMAEGRKRKAAEKAAATEGNTSSASSVADAESGTESASSGKHRGRPKGSKNKPKAEPATEPAAVVAEAPTVMKNVLLKGHRYMMDPSTNGLWHKSADGSRGAWAGIYDPATKSIDDSAAEPMSEEELDA